MDPVRVLFVDDEPSIRLTLPQILKLHGFEVTTAATVAEALNAISHVGFDVLVADLNIGQPGDGFTVVSAMRRTHPEAVTIILTGYPAFETALQAIRNQVDDYAVKPADVKELVRSIEDKLARRGPRDYVPLKRLGQLLRENQSRILNDWLALVKADRELAGLPISDEERTKYVLHIIIELSEHLELPQGPDWQPEQRRSDRDFGRQRREAGYSAEMLVREVRLIRKIVQITIQAHLLALDMSKALPDMMQVDEYLDRQLELLLHAFLERDEIAA